MSPSPRALPRRLGWAYRWMMGLVGYFERWLLTSCRAFTRLASERHERPLTRIERTRQALHRLVCGVCRMQERRMERLRNLVREIGRTPDEPSAIRLSADAERSIREALAAEIDRHQPPSGKGH